MQTIEILLTTIANILFPQTCAGCRELNTLLCKRCISSAPRAEASPHSFITAVFDYQNPLIQKSIWRFKYKNVRGFAAYFGPLLYEEIVGDLGENLYISKNENFLVVPIPLYKKRMRERGYNQSELLTRAIMKNDKGSLFTFSSNALARVRETKTQARSDKRASRLENLRGAFRANNDLVQGKDILLIDDVTTTGATFSEARKALRAAGARSVRAYAVAH